MDAKRGAPRALRQSLSAQATAIAQGSTPGPAGRTAKGVFAAQARAEEEEANDGPLNQAHSLTGHSSAEQQSSPSALVLVGGEEWCLTQVLFLHMDQAEDRKTAKKYFHRWLKESAFAHLKVDGADLRVLRKKGFADNHAPVAILVRHDNLDEIAVQFNAGRSSYTLTAPGEEVSWIQVQLTLARADHGEPAHVKRARSITLPTILPSYEAGFDSLDLPTVLPTCETERSDFDLLDLGDFPDLSPLELSSPRPQQLSISPLIIRAQTSSWICVKGYSGPLHFVSEDDKPYQFLDVDIATRGTFALLPPLVEGTSVFVVAGNDKIPLFIADDVSTSESQSGW